jgi:RNA polymerase-associated protein LEO1
MGVHERLSSPERNQRRELEYEEEDQPEPVFEQILEAAVEIPNIPLPKSTDGDVSKTQNPLHGSE